MEKFRGLGLANFDIANKKDRDLRRCRTRAFAAHLFARYPLHPSNAEAWAYVARAWEDLAILKEHMSSADETRPFKHGS